MLLALYMLMLGVNAEAACPATAVELAQLTDQALLSYESWEWDAFDSARASLDSAVLCAADPLDPLAASRVHLVHALAAGLTKDEAIATTHFRSLLVTDPSYVLPDSLAAPGSLLQRAFEAAKLAEPGDTRRVRADELWVDGAEARRLPVDRPFVAQSMVEDGLKTWIVAGEPLPDDLTLALGPPPTSRRTLALGVTGGASVIAGGALLFLASQTADQLDPSLTWNEGDALLRRNRSLAVGGVGLGAAGLALGAVGVTLELKR